MYGRTCLGLFFAAMSASGCYKAVTVYPLDLPQVLEEASARANGPVRGHDEANRPVVATGPVQGVLASIEGEPEPVKLPSLSAVRIDHVGATETHMLTLALEGGRRTIPLAKLDRLDVRYRNPIGFYATGSFLLGVGAIDAGISGYWIARSVTHDDPFTMTVAIPMAAMSVGMVVAGIVLLVKGSTTTIEPAPGAKPKSAFVELGPGGLRGAF